MDSLIPYLIADITILLVVVRYWIMKTAFWHPLTVYLLFHLYSFTWRVVQLISGAVPMYGNTVAQEIIRPEEFERAIMLADVSLVCFTLGSAIAQAYFFKKIQDLRLRRGVSMNVVYVICACCLPLGLLMRTFVRSGVEINADLASSNYLTVIAMWPISCLIVLAFVKGFRMIIVIPICLYLVNVALQGYHRFMLVLPLLCISALYLQGKEKKWPTKPMIVLGLVVMLIFPRLKFIGRAVEVGDLNGAVSLVTNAFYNTSDERAGTDQDFTSEQFLDQFAGALSMIDEGGKTYWGTTYFAIVTLPIPRQLWPNKPGLADFMYDISTVGRPYSTEGRIMTYIGESYLNFWYPGVILIPLILGFGLSYWCHIATNGPWLTLNRYMYLIGFMAFTQLFRDGILSLPLFSLIHNLPAFFIWVAHLFLGPRLIVQDSPISSR